MANSIEELWSLVSTSESPQVSYRLYHDEQGYLLFYSMEHLPGTYIEITAEQFARADSHVKVVNGQVVRLNRSLVKKLVPGIDGINCSAYSVAVPVADTDPGQKWCIKNYETD